MLSKLELVSYGILTGFDSAGARRVVIFGESECCDHVAIILSYSGGREKSVSRRTFVCSCLLSERAGE